MTLENRLITDCQLADPDTFYQALIATHEGLSDEQSQLLNAQMILLLCNHIGDLPVLQQAMDTAKHCVLQQQEVDSPCDAG